MSKNIITVHEDLAICKSLYSIDDCLLLIDRLNVADFTDYNNENLFKQVVICVNKDKNISPLSIERELVNKGDLKKFHEIVALKSEASSKTLDELINFIIEKSRIRVIEKFCQDSINGISQGQTSEDLANRLMSGVISLGNRKDSFDLESLKDIFPQAQEHLKNKAGLFSGIKAFDELTGGIKRKEISIFAGLTAMGKAQPIDTPILMQDGTWKEIGKLKIGDKIASVDGKENIVEGIFPRGQLNVYEIEFSGGVKTKCCEEHLWKVNSSTSWRKPRIINTKQIEQMLTTVRYKNRLSIECINGNFGKSENKIIHPYIMGALIGDGCLTAGAVISNYNKDIYANITQYLDARFIANWRNNNTVISIKARNYKDGTILRNELKRLNLFDKRSYEKFIPKEYLTLPYEDRLMLFQGLMDTDGTADPRGSMSYSTTSLQLAKDVEYLARSLGAITKTSDRITKFKDKNNTLKFGRKSYKIIVRHPNREKFTTLDYKKAACDSLKEKRIKPYNPKSIIKQVNNLNYKDECLCISVSHDSNLYVTENFIATHNSTMSLNYAFNIAKNQNIPVAFFSIEMAKEDLLYRIISNVGNIEHWKFSKRKLSPKDEKSFSASLGALNNIPLYINDRSDINIQSIISKCIGMKMKYGDLGAIFIDFIQLMKMGRYGESDNVSYGLGEMCKSLKGLAKDLNTAVVLVSQVKREVADRDEKRPVNSDLSKSTELEQQAGLIVFPFRPYVYSKDKGEERECELIVTKNRHGEIGTAYCRLDLDFQRFTNKPVI